MNRFTRYFIIIIAVVVITALLIYSQTFTQGGQGADVGNSSAGQSQTSDEIDSSESTEDSNDISSDTSEEDSSDVSSEDSSSSKDEHIHQALERLIFDESYHWKECSCGEVLDKSAHEFEYVAQDNGAHAYVKKCVCGYQEELQYTYLSQTQKLPLNAQVKDGQAAVNTEQTVFVTLDKPSEKVVFVKYNGREIAYTHNENIITLFASAFAFDYGEAELELLTDNGYYGVCVLLITKQLQTKADLDSLNVLSKACEQDERKYGGYFTLANNIEYNGVWQGGIATRIDDQDARSGQYGFCGVFDGCGYSISGMEQAGEYAYDGFIGVLCGGVIKNVKFASASLLYSGGLVCAAGVGEIENVCVEYAQFGSEMDKGKAFGTFFGCWAGAGAVVKDCLIDCNSKQMPINRYGYLIGAIAYEDNVQDGVLQGVYVLVDQPMQNIVYEQSERTDIFGSYKNVAALKSDENAKAELLTWNEEYWLIDDENIIFKAK